MTDLMLTNKQAFTAMLYFLNKMHQNFGWEELGALLGSMALIDGVPVDIAFVDDWKEAVQSALDSQNEDTYPRTLTSEQVYASMVHFLDQMFFDAKREMLKPLIEDMTSVDGLPIDLILIESWERAIKFTENGGKAAPFTVTKDGITYEVHRGPENLKQ
jgi:hypothetical protein